MALVGISFEHFESSAASQPLLAVVQHPSTQEPCPQVKHGVVTEHSDIKFIEGVKTMPHWHTDSVELEVLV